MRDAQQATLAAHMAWKRGATHLPVCLLQLPVPPFSYSLHATSTEATEAALLQKYFSAKNAVSTILRVDNKLLFY